jgi:hypothetical protein
LKKYEEEFRASLVAQRELGMRGDSWDNYALARTVLHDDLDGGNHTPLFNLDEERRGRLLAHARQDASHTLANTTSLLRRVQRLTWLVYSLLAVAIWRELSHWLP